MDTTAVRAVIGSLRRDVSLLFQASPARQLGFLATWRRIRQRRKVTVVSRMIRGDERPELAALAAIRPWELP